MNHGMAAICFEFSSLVFPYSPRNRDMMKAIRNIDKVLMRDITHEKEIHS